MGTPSNYDQHQQKWRFGWTRGLSCAYLTTVWRWQWWTSNNSSMDRRPFWEEWCRSLRSKYCNTSLLYLKSNLFCRNCTKGVYGWRHHVFFCLFSFPFNIHLVFPQSHQTSSLVPFFLLICISLLLLDHDRCVLIYRGPLFHTLETVDTFFHISYALKHNTSK